MTATSPPCLQSNIDLQNKKEYSPQLAAKKVHLKANSWQKVGFDVTKFRKHCINIHIQTVLAAPIHFKIYF